MVKNKEDQCIDYSHQYVRYVNMTTNEFYFKKVFQIEYFFFKKQDEIYGDLFDTYFRFYKECSTYENDEMLNSNFTKNI